MWARRAAPLLLAALALARCGGSDLPTPAPSSVTPDRAFAGNTTPIVIHGAGFSVLAVQPSSGGSPTVDETFQAWMGGQLLQEVRRVDDRTLSAIVPAGLALGPKTLRVQGPFGTSGDLASAFTVEGSALASIAVAITATPARVNVGQSLTVVLTVTNAGSSAATNAVPAAPTVTGTGTVGTPTGPVPASIATLAPGASGTFTWTYPASGAGTLAFAGSASAIDTFSGTAVTGVTVPASPARATVEIPAALTASLPSSGAAAVGQEFTVAMTVTNAGGATARNLVPAAPTLTPAGLATLKAGTGPVPTSVASLAGGVVATFTWTFVAGSTPGTVRISSSATGTDANSGAAVASGTAISGNFTLGAAGMQATLEAAPAVANLGQAIHLTLTLTNPGLADVRNFAVGVPAASSADGAEATLIAGPSPAPPVVLAAGQTLAITWSFSAALATSIPTGHLSFLVTASGTDAFSGGPIAAQATAPATVQTPADVTAQGVVASPSTLNAGQTFTLTLTLGKTGTAQANVTSVGVVGASCTAPATPVNGIVDGQTLQWTGCVAAATGTVTATANWVDVNVGTPAAVSASTTVTVQGAAGVTAQGVVASPSTMNAGQTFTLTLTLGKTGTAQANVTSVGVVGASCTAPATPVNGIVDGQTLQWTGCTAAATGTVTATANWVDVNVGGAATAAEASTTVTVQLPAVVSATSLAADPSIVTVDTTFTLTLTLGKTGTAQANVTSVAVAGATCTALTTPVIGIVDGQTLQWTGCTAVATGTVTATANWVDVNVGGAATAAEASTTIEVQ